MDATEKLLGLGEKLVQNGLVAGAGGNLSVRDGDVFWVTPSGFGLAEILLEDLVAVSIDTGEFEHPTNQPTCEFQMHAMIYRRREDINVIVHAHPSYVIGVCSSGNQIQPMTPDAAAFLHPVRQIRYIEPGGNELAETAADQLAEGCNVLIMENHGAITLGRSCREAFMRTELLEEAAMTQFIAASSGTPRFLTADQIEAINNLTIEKYRQDLAAEDG